MQKKNLTPWIILLAAPFVGLVVVMILQMTMRFAFYDSTPRCRNYDSPTYVSARMMDEGCTTEPQNPLVTSVNVLSMFVGVLSVMGIMLSPIWLVFLIVNYEHNRKVAEQPGAKTAAPTKKSRSTKKTPKPKSKA